MLPIFMHAKCFMQLVHEQVISNLPIIINGKNFIVDNTDSRQAAMQGRLNIGGRQFEPVVWYKHACLRKLYALIAVVWLSSATGGFDGSMMNGLQSLSYWETYFNNPSPSTLGLMNPIVPAGNFAINFFVPYMADGIGRKNTLIVGLLVLFVGIGLQTGATNMGMFIASRFIGGVGASMGTGPYLITELAHPQHRPTVTAIYNTTYYIGAIIAAWATYGTLFIQSEWAWRLPSLLQYVTPLIQFALIWFVPESPRYLINKDRPDEARAILAKYHGPTSGPEFVQLSLTRYGRLPSWKGSLESEDGGNYGLLKGIGIVS
jgi:MFS family permease